MEERMRIREQARAHNRLAEAQNYAARCSRGILAFDKPAHFGISADLVGS